ncbi:uncharacterized protein TNCV_3076681 [Trichonephila clavipes]|nr:uncharacterized protein TNCV_3076681 [Trichonephila clavipes]
MPLVVRALDTRLEGLGSMPVPRNTLRVHTKYVLVKSMGPKVLWAESRVQGTGKNIPPLQFHAKIVECLFGLGAVGTIKILSQFRIARAQVPPSGVETGRQNYLR